VNIERAHLSKVYNIEGARIAKPIDILALSRRRRCQSIGIATITHWYIVISSFEYSTLRRYLGYHKGRQSWFSLTFGPIVEVSVLFDTFSSDFWACGSRAVTSFTPSTRALVSLALPSVVALELEVTFDELGVLLRVEPLRVLPLGIAHRRTTFLVISYCRC
jgi:hypothetical protein